jgi:ABC-2 type transport system permease protein
MSGFSMALVFAKGMPLLAVLPSLAAFFLMITALTYQFQGWLGSLVNDPRRRRTVVVAMTTIFVLIFQLPNLLNIYSPWGVQARADRSAILVEELAKLDRASRSGRIDPAEHLRRQQELIHEHRLVAQQADREIAEKWQQSIRILNLVLPVGWLPLGVMTAAEGRVAPSILGLSGMTLIATTSLWRAYRATVRQYQGQSTNRKGRGMHAAAPPATGRGPGGLLLEARLPGLSEPVSAIALGGIRSFFRSPEAKMMLLTPLITIPIFGSMLLRGRDNLPETVRPLLAIAAMAFVLLGGLQLTGNQFGFDRDGFRVFVLSAAPRRDILLGKNLAFVPVVFGIATILLPIVQMVCPMRPDHVLAMIPQ